MNYLAHFHLAGDQPGLIVGALLGDYVKGPLRGAYPADWERGIRLHRRIDALTDNHPLVSQRLAALPAGYRRYGGIMLDVCFDHCLSRHWSDFHPQPLSDFSAGIFAQLAPHLEALPPGATRQARRLQQFEVLENMERWRTVENMLARIGQRLKRDNPLGSSATVLAEQYADIERTFLALYPELVAQLDREFSIWR